MRKSDLFSCLFCVILLVGIITPSQSFAKENDLVIRVNKGATLGEICKGYLENPGDWKKVAKINRLKNPNLIYPGQKIVIPFHLLKKLIGKVTFIRGKVLKRAVGKEWKPLKLGDKVSEGDEIKTGEEGGVEFSYVDESRILLRAKSEIKIKTSMQRGPYLFLRDFFLKVGRLITKLRRLTGKGSRYSIETPSGVASARGTRYRVRADQEKTFGEVLEGAVRVEAMKKYVNVMENEGTRVKKGREPEPPRKLLPPPRPVQFKAPYKRFPVSIRFSEVGKAISYRIVLANDREVKDVVLASTIKPSGALVVSDIPDGTYFFQSSSIDDIGLEGIPSKAISLLIRINPKPPVISFPKDIFEKREGNQMEIKWRQVPDAAKYHIIIARDWDFKTIKHESSDIKNTLYRIEHLDYGTYFFKVSSIASDGYEGEFSPWGSFVLAPPPSSDTAK